MVDKVAGVDRGLDGSIGLVVDQDPDFDSGQQVVDDVCRVLPVITTS